MDEAVNVGDRFSFGGPVLVVWEVVSVEGLAVRLSRVLEDGRLVGTLIESATNFANHPEWRVK